jgi:hypothetical protein
MTAPVFRQALCVRRANWSCVTGSPSFNVGGFRLAAVSELPCQLSARLSFYMQGVGRVSIYVGVKLGLLH